MTANHTHTHSTSLSFCCEDIYPGLSYIYNLVWTMNQLEVRGWPKKRFLTTLSALSQRWRATSLWNVVTRGTSI